MADLRRHLPTAPAPYLEGALSNPALAEAEMGLLLRNRTAPASLLVRIVRDARWTHHYEVKKSLVRHPNVPLPVARGLLHHLYWRDLAETAEDPRVHPVLRRQSEELLKLRVVELTIGERISLARRAGRGLIASLLACGERQVLEALIGNTYLQELDALRLAKGQGVPGGVLGKLAEHPRWGSRPAVRMALAGNPRTPVPVALKLLGRLSGQELRRLAKDVNAPKIVRVGADRQLESPARRRRAAPSGQGRE